MHWKRKLSALGAALLLVACREATTPDQQTAD